MYAIAFDLVVADVVRHHPRSISSAYADIGAILAGRGFRWAQGSLYLSDNEDMANLFLAVQELTACAWFRKSVRDIRAFRVEQWSDFTALAQGTRRPTAPLAVREPEAIYA